MALEIHPLTPDRWLDQGDTVTVGLISARGKKRRIKLQTTLDVRYLPRLPVPIKGVSDSANVAWTTLPGDIGYIYVRRIREDLIDTQHGLRLTRGAVHSSG